MNSCPCGSSAAYTDCCQPIISGERSAETVEQLMRARYSAYTNAEIDFLFNTTHPDHRKGYDHTGTKEWAENSEWLGLEVISTSQGGPDDTVGEVEFIARFREKESPNEHHELGHFRQENGRWYFTNGTMVKPKPVISSKIGRNAPCTCGSGLKYKKCCGK